MTELYSQARADLYNMAYDMPPDELIDFSELKPHIRALLCSRLRQSEDEETRMYATAREVRDCLAPTFGEARDIALHREATLMYANQLQLTGHKYIKHHQMSVEIVDFLYDHLPADMRDLDEYELSYVIPLLRPHYEELVAEARRGSYERLPRWQKMPWQIKHQTKKKNR